MEMWSASNRRKGWFLTKFENRRNSGGAVGRCGKVVMYLISRALISKLLVSYTSDQQVGGHESSLLYIADLGWDWTVDQLAKLF